MADQSTMLGRREKKGNLTVFLDFFVNSFKLVLVFILQDWSIFGMD